MARDLRKERKLFPFPGERIMDVSSLPSNSSLQRDSDEAAQALRLLGNVITPEWVDALCPSSPQAVFTSYIVLWMLIYQRLHQNAPLTSAVSMFLQQMASLSTSKRVQDKTLSTQTGGFSRARQRFPVAVAEHIADHVFQSLLPAASTWLPGRRVFLVDGSTIKLRPQKELHERWPAGRQGSPWPICQLAVLHELETGMMLRPEAGPMYGDEATSEMSLAEPLLRRLPAHSVLMADIGFGVFSFAFAATQAGHDVVLRLKKDRFVSMQKKATPVRPGMWQLCWTPTAENRRSFPDLPADAKVKAYLHEFIGYSGQQMWIVTTLSIETDQAAKLYAHRAEVETDIRQWKKPLKLDELRGKSVEMILKELAIGSVTYNLVIQVRRLAAERGKIAPRRISFTGVWHLLMPMFLFPRERTMEEWHEEGDLLLKRALQQKIPLRPNRSYPRTAYRKSFSYDKKDFEEGS